MNVVKVLVITLVRIECQIQAQCSNGEAVARTNAHGKSVVIELVADHPAIGMDITFPYQEGAFFGNLFVEEPFMIACTGDDAPDAQDDLEEIGRVCALGDGEVTECGFEHAGDCDAICAHSSSEGYRDCGGTAEVITVFLISQ